MKQLKIILSIFLVLLLTLNIYGQKKGKDMQLNIDIPYTKFVLDNGLTLIVHEDHKAPIVAVNVWYHVGSKNEKPGKTGFAHLFEHLMFNGSENFDDDYFQAMERIGATDLNGTTNEDRTNYFQNVPTSALDIALWMESDRMGHLLGAVTQAKLDEQRGVVQNEKRQGENQPYGKVWELISKGTYPAGHPYSWTVIGSMEDLNAASLEDVHEWFKTYYGPNNAVLVIAGDVNTQEVYEKVKKYFGDIPPGPPIAKHQVWIAKMSGTKRQIMQDRVPQARIYKVWNIPQWGTEELTYLDLVSDVLGSGKTSRLYKRLVYDEQICTSVQVYASPGEIGSQFMIVATAKPGIDLKKVEESLDDELNKFLKEGPTEKELERVKTEFEASFIRGIERIGGFGGKSDILAQNQVFGGSPDYYKKVLNWVRNATTKNLKDVAQDWLSDGVYILEVHPYPELKAIPSDVDRSKLPEQGPAPEIKFPELQKAQLKNGLKVVLAERHSIPVVNFNLVVDAGYAADQFALPGTSKLTMEMIDEGTKKRTALQISEELSLLGASLGSGSDLDVSYVSLSALKNKLDESLDIFADVILNPVFPEEDFNRLKAQTIAAIQREKVTPTSMALRVFPKILYGENHAYGNPMTGSGTEESVKKITRDDLIKFHQTWFKPNNSTLVIVGDITLDEILPKLEKLFDGWKPGTVPVKNISEVAHKEKSVVYILDRPGSLQSLIFAGHIAPSSSDPDDIAIEMMNTIFGGAFTSRINMNLREDKHWSYGASSFLMGARGQRPFIVYASVQTDKTKESMVEIKKELEQIKTTKPPTEEELNKNKQNEILALPGSWETMRSVLGSIVTIVKYNLPDDYYQKYPQKLQQLNLDDVKRATNKVIQPDKLVWVVVGDRSKIEKGIRELNYGEIYFVDSDGNPIQ
ncbi:MAG: insulinase family protein [Ignavibacteria bacterium]|jgi:zinc protease|nr:insulinase family protein [Ignavibacteria bacterium]MDH7528796.1 pitrilysin family protein [Ignavibacteria bacterium]